jgi:hypothetical protein
MVNALMNIDENTNRVLNIIKAQYGLKDKSEAVSFVVRNYIENKDEPELRIDFVRKMNEIEAQKSIKVDDFFKSYVQDV